MDLTGIAPITVPNNGLPGMELATDAQDVVDGTDTVEKERLPKLFAQPDFLAEHTELQVVGRVAQPVETTLTDSKNGGRRGRRSRRGRRQEVPGMTATGLHPVLNDEGFPVGGRVVGMEVYVCTRFHLLRFNFYFPYGTGS